MSRHWASPREPAEFPADVTMSAHAGPAHGSALCQASGWHAHAPATANLALTMAPALKTIIHQRQLFASSMIDGRTAGELEPRSTAAEGITALWRELSTHVRLDGKE